MFLGLNVDYKYLSHNGVYLGMMVFKDTNKIPIFDPETNRAGYIEECANTIMIDSRLLEANQEHRYRYTMGHECGHAVFHSAVYANSGGIPCRLEKRSTGRTNTHEWLDDDWMEWHANSFSAATLMPKSSVEICVERQGGIPTNVLKLFNLIYCISETFNVSEEAAKHRLKTLGYLEYLLQQKPSA